MAGAPTEIAVDLTWSVDGLPVTVTAMAHGPTLLTDQDGDVWPFPRSLARFDTAAGSVVGWIEWNRPDQRSL